MTRPNNSRFDFSLSPSTMGHKFDHELNCYSCGEHWDDIRPGVACVAVSDVDPPKAEPRKVWSVYCDSCQHFGPPSLDQADRCERCRTPFPPLERDVRKPCQCASRGDVAR